MNLRNTRLHIHPRDIGKAEGSLDASISHRVPIAHVKSCHLILGVQNVPKESRPTASRCHRPATLTRRSGNSATSVMAKPSPIQFVRASLTCLAHGSRLTATARPLKQRKPSSMSASTTMLIPSPPPGTILGLSPVHPNFRARLRLGATSRFRRGTDDRSNDTVFADMWRNENNVFSFRCDSDV